MNASSSIQRPGWSAQSTRTEATSRRPNGPSRPGGPTKVGVSKPANTSRQAARSAARSRPASQLTNLRYGRGTRVAALPVIAGEQVPQQHRQRPTVEHDVVIRQHKPGADLLRCGGGPPGTEPKLLGQVADGGALGGAQLLDLLIDVQTPFTAEELRYTAGAPRHRPG